PWVTTPDLKTLGLGNVEVLPRKVLVLYDPAHTKDVQESEPQTLLGFVFAYLGLVPDYRSLTTPPPDGDITGRYAGAVVWMERDNALARTEWPDWLVAQAQAGLPLAVFGSFGFGSDSARLQALGLVLPELPENAAPTLTNKDASLMGFELPVRARSDLAPLRLAGAGKPLVTLQARHAGALHPAALTAWGGYVTTPYVLEVLPGEESRWLVNPLAFLRAALRLDPAVPVPDVTTENGRRLFFVHIDGDGFASQAERRGTKAYAGEVMRDEILKRYRWPTTTSVVEGETGAQGLYPKLSPRLEKAARDIFALPWVEVATHTYSHPFFWHDAEQASGKDDGGGQLHLDIPKYRFSLAREIAGSRDYINRHLTDAKKPVKVVLWTGDCTPSENALAEAERAGLYNMNGGDTTITKRFTSWTRIAGIGVAKGGRFQVFAPNQNENVYTNDWTGPFYGFDRVIETFELTDRPYRFKPVNLYYHFYSASKEASLQALHRIYRWIGTQPLHPVWGSDYIRKVLDYNSLVIARTPQGFRVRGGGEMRTLRVSQPDWQPDFAASRQLAGMAPAPEGRYLSLAGGSAEIVRAGKSAGVRPWLAEANARLSAFERRGSGLRFGLSGLAPLEFALGGATHCRLHAGETTLAPQRRSGDLQHFRLEQSDVHDLDLDCPA
ncbi:MAG: hypothetical protein K0S16_1330, partial [Moraxellaceae bacterium]|nr:hypothetical protein [Moraxellaceae bacterium]